MSWQTPAQKTCHAKISGWMADNLFGETLWEPLTETNGFRLFMGSAWVDVDILAFQEDTIVRVCSTVVTNATVGSSLQAFLLHKNAELLFGGFAIDAEGNVLFRHSIVGSTCDPKELKTSVENVLATADLYDDRIVDLWGGERARDRGQP